MAWISILGIIIIFEIETIDSLGEYTSGRRLPSSTRTCEDICMPNTILSERSTEYIRDGILSDEWVPVTRAIFGIERHWILIDYALIVSKNLQKTIKKSLDFWGIFVEILFIHDTFKHTFFSSELFVLEFSEELFHKTTSKKEYEYSCKEWDSSTDSCVIRIEIFISQCPDTPPE
jgi:hypothetical protein